MSVAKLANSSWCSLDLVKRMKTNPDHRCVSIMLVHRKMRYRKLIRVGYALLFFVWAALTRTVAAESVSAGDIKITFVKPLIIPPGDLLTRAHHAGIVREASQASNSSSETKSGAVFDNRNHGPFSNVVAGRIAAITVTWSDERVLKTEGEAEDFLRRVLSSATGSTEEACLWAEGLGIPHLVAAVEHTEGKSGTWLLWYGPGSVHCVYQDATGKWWFSRMILRLPRDMPEALIPQLTDPDVEVRWSAVLRLIGAAPGNTKAGKALLPLLNDPSPELRSLTALTLGSVREPVDEIVLALLKSLRDENAAVRNNSVQALESFADRADKVVPELLRAIEDPDENVRVRICFVLGHLGHGKKNFQKQAVSALDKKTKDVSWQVRVVAASALGDLGLASEKIIPH